eukprot:c9600_g1_i1.p1 GENE.c9600_g1_i1~~c9600_g1_i1.p1  ORF type:complete len:441 (-),score=108.64 c9600_g1_i1:95-1417(-)
MGCRPLVALFGAVLVLCENLIVLQSRLILTDVFLYAFNMLTIAASFASTRPTLTFSRQVMWCAITGFLLGCSVSVKLTALGTIGTVGVHQALVLLTELQSQRSPQRNYDTTVFRGLAKATVLLSIMFAVFVSLWVVHVKLLPYNGQGDSFMIQRFQQTLIPKPDPKSTADTSACPNHINAWSDCGFGGITPKQCEELGCCYDPTSPSNWCYHIGDVPRPSMSMVDKVWDAVRATHQTNQGGAVMTHPSMSEWWEWPLLQSRMVLFGGSGRGGHFRSMGNPIVWWGVVAVLVLSFAIGIFSLIVRASSLFFTSTASQSCSTLSPTVSSPSWFITITTLWFGYLGNLLPYHFIARSKFNYHYVPALLMGILLWAACFEKVLQWTETGWKRGWVRVMCKLVVLLVLLGSGVGAGWGFYYWGHFTYGWKLSVPETTERKWLPNW